MASINTSAVGAVLFAVAGANSASAEDVAEADPERCDGAPPVESALSELEAAYGDDSGWVEATDGFRRALECADQQVTAVQAARIHRAQGLIYFTDGVRDRTTLSFSTARTLSGAPEFELPGIELPDQHPLRELWRAAPTADETDTAPHAVGGTLWFDGANTAQRPTQRATFVQYLPEEDGVASSAYLLPGDPLPHYPRVHPARRPLLFVAGGGLAVAGGLYALAYSSYQAHSETAPGDPGREDLRVKTNRRQTAAVAVAAVSAGTGVVGLTLKLR